jgi:hypothetical protein
MKKARFDLLVIILLACASCMGLAQSPNDLAGFGAARWGMTRDEVMAAFKGQARRLKKPVTFGRIVGVVEVRQFEIYGSKFGVFFGFDNAGRLNGVELSAYPGTETMFESLERRLTEEHGVPTSQETSGDRATPAGMLRQTTWRVPNTVISLHYRLVPGINLQYVTVLFTPGGNGAK